MATFLHYVGGRYSPQTFIAEAQQYGITRRANAQNVKALNFGDTILLVDHRQGRPAVFGSFTLTDIIFDANINAELLPLLQANGVVESVQDFGGSPITVRRKCGSFTITGSVSLRTRGEDETPTADETQDAETTEEEPRISVAELIELAQAIQAQQQSALGVGDEERGSLWCMVGGSLTTTYFPPRTLVPAPAFTRGFMRLPEGTSFVETNPESINEPNAPRMVSVGQYERAWHAGDGED